MRIAHLSDLHFAKVCLSPLQFFSKRWLGNLNLLFCRHEKFDYAQLAPLAQLFKSLQVDLVLITGDLTTTSQVSEFRMVETFTRTFAEKGIELIAIPGNHDHYTRGAYKQRLFYKFFPQRFDSSFSLSKQGVSVKALSDGWYLVLLDTALATSYISSRGLFSPAIEEHLTNILRSIPQNSPVLMVNHFPFFDPDGPRRKLVRGEELRTLLMRYPNVKLYLHGHTHRHTIADLRPSGLPIVIDSGSSSQRKEGAWNLLDLGPNSCEVTPFYWKGAQGWQPQEIRKVLL